MCWLNLYSSMNQRDAAGFFFAGLLNNMSYVIMAAGAKNIAPSLVGVVYACNIVPSFVVKSTGPYWFHLVPYYWRIVIASILMSASFIIVSVGLMTDIVWIMLLGVTIGSAQCGLGESSFLALTAFYDSRSALTAWSSGTGFAGILGYGWVIMFTQGFQASFKLTLLCALSLPVLYYANYIIVLSQPIINREKDNPLTPSLLPHNGLQLESNSSSNNSKIEERENQSSAGTMTTSQRLSYTLSLWPFMIPLFLVYFAEYAMQAGVWAAVGFPIDDSDSRQLFYEYSNWTYQVGVLVSRSSGMLWKADMKALWVMPVMQCVILGFFVADAYMRWWYNWSLLLLCFIVGLFGGAVYVGGFSLIAETVPPHLKEFSLSAASLGSDIGIACATVAGVFIQRALYHYHDISDDDD
jgi:battenin